MIFYKKLSKLKECDISTPFKVEPFDKSMSVDDLDKLALQSGKLSRFYLDPFFTYEQYSKLYKTWIKKSLNRSIAKEVLVVRDNDKVIATITLGDKNGCGDIGLLAVDSNFRGRKLGEVLMNSAENYFLQSGYRDIKVITQLDNLPACNLYRKCGYNIEKVEYVYHIWI